jgi:hypothetical protein
MYIQDKIGMIDFALEKWLEIWEKKWMEKWMEKWLTKALVKLIESWISEESGKKILGMF